MGSHFEFYLFVFVSLLDYLFEILNEFPIDESKIIDNEIEQEYLNTLITIRNNIFPTPKGEEEEYEASVKIEMLDEWSERLNMCTEKMGLLYLIIWGKYIKAITNVNS